MLPSGLDGADRVRACNGGVFELRSRLDRGCQRCWIDRHPLGDRDDDRSRAVEQLLGVDDRDADELAVPVEAQGVSLGGLVEVDGLVRLAHVEVQHVDIGVVVDAVEGRVPNGDAHGSDLRANAVTIEPLPSTHSVRQP